MPSLHVAFAVLVAIIVWRRSFPLGLLLAIYAAIMQVGSVVLGWHYAVDGYAGALCAWGAWVAAGYLCGSSRTTTRGVCSSLYGPNHVGPLDCARELQRIRSRLEHQLPF